MTASALTCIGLDAVDAVAAYRPSTYIDAVAVVVYRPRCGQCDRRGIWPYPSYPSCSVIVNKMAEEESECKTPQKAKNVLNMSRSLNWNSVTNLNVWLNHRSASLLHSVMLWKCLLFLPIFEPLILPIFGFTGLTPLVCNVACAESDDVGEYCMCSSHSGWRSALLRLRTWKNVSLSCLVYLK